MAGQAEHRCSPVHCVRTPACCGILSSEFRQLWIWDLEVLASWTFCFLLLMTRVGFTLTRMELGMWNTNVSEGTLQEPEL